MNYKIEYKVDMIRFRLPFIDKIMQIWFDWLNFDEAVEYWESHKINSYRHNWKIKVTTETSIYMGLQQNSENNSDRTLVIEFNPNKIDISKVENNTFNRLLNFGFKSRRDEDLEKLDVLNFDIAIDISRAIDCLKFRNTKQIEGYIKSSLGNTYYFGKRGSNGFTKIYDKGAENGSGDDLTRYEITYKPSCKFDDVDEIKDLINKTQLVDIYHHIDTWEDINGTDRGLILSIQHPDIRFTIDDLPRRKRDKIDKIYENKQKKICIDPSKVLNAYTEYIDYIRNYYVNEYLTAQQRDRLNTGNAYNTWLEDKQLI